MDLCAAWGGDSNAGRPSCALRLCSAARRRRPGSRERGRHGPLLAPVAVAADPRPAQRPAGRAGPLLGAGECGRRPGPPGVRPSCSAARGLVRGGLLLAGGPAGELGVTVLWSSRAGGPGSVDTTSRPRVVPVHCAAEEGARVQAPAMLSTRCEQAPPPRVTPEPGSSLQTSSAVWSPQSAPFRRPHLSTPHLAAPLRPFSPSFPAVPVESS